ncbi:hypothetical protein [Synechococcus sp. MU1642]|uniref:hypothetical protein n=1 Tax=Synechococcus sp. MU1642 TaxID=2508348 RepID=UPI001CF80FA6|nr:hypothetical protein [Synechococcus sp. MU1642]MCB4406960.1 hypothetical protein [Synechococcus sp. MU1642]
MKKEFTVFFRTSRRCGKNPFARIDSSLTLKSLLKSFKDSEIVCICDNVSDAQYGYFASTLPFVYRTSRGNCGSFRLSLRLASLHPAKIFYFVEDDHLHLPGQKKWLRQGLNHFDFVSLYDHPDKYLAEMYAGLTRRIVLTSVGHFASVPSTVMTFACREKTLASSAKIMLKEKFTGNALSWPNDHDLFLELKNRGYTLGTSIPGRSTHCEAKLLSPGVDWDSYLDALR